MRNLIHYQGAVYHAMLRGVKKVVRYGRGSLLAGFAELLPVAMELVFELCE